MCTLTTTTPISNNLIKSSGWVHTFEANTSTKEDVVGLISQLLEDKLH